MLAPEELELQVVLILVVDQMAMTLTLVEHQVRHLFAQPVEVLVEVELLHREMAVHLAALIIKILQAVAQLQVQQETLLELLVHQVH
jgi:hypothetical protein